MGKGDTPRPFSTGQEERNLRNRYMRGEITIEQFNQEYETLLKAGKITRHGRQVTQ